MKQKDRLQSGKNCIGHYTGNHPVKSYMKCYGVDLPCAITELQCLGVKLDQHYIAQALLNREALIAARKRKKESSEEFISEEDELDFAFIAGYTSGGFPYGIRKEEMETFDAHES